MGQARAEIGAGENYRWVVKQNRPADSASGNGVEMSARWQAGRGREQRKKRGAGKWRPVKNRGSLKIGSGKK